MAPDFFPSLLLGHLIGDYLLQNNWMAMNKSASHLKCLVHCTLYTAAVVACTWTSIHGLWWTLLVFLSHYPIDRWGLADKWLDLIHGRSLSGFIMNGKRNMPDGVDVQNYHALRGAFTGIVYVCADNTMHLAIMYWGAKLLI